MECNQRGEEGALRRSACTNITTVSEGCDVVDRKLDITSCRVA
jgi:hypothetical protein